MAVSIFSFIKKDLRTSHVILLAERMGFEPMRDLHPLAVFETAPFNHLGTSPVVVIITQIFMVLFEYFRVLVYYFVMLLA